MTPIVWLASYPKSGNTWFRAFLANLLAEGEDPAVINELRTGSIASARDLFDVYTGLEASDLTPDEIDALRPDVYRRMAEAAAVTGYHKVHDAYTHTTAGPALFPADATEGAIYLLRNPLDVVGSYAHHSARDTDWAVAAMGNPEHCMARGKHHLANQLRQRLLTWSRHVTSWVDDADFPVEVIRYEDMLHDGFATFSRAVRFAGIDAEEAGIRTAMEHSSFSKLKAQEDELGFRERNPKADSFFRKGIAGSWRESLTEQQAARVIADHGVVMERFGYLKDGEPVW